MAVEVRGDCHDDAIAEIVMPGATTCAPKPARISVACAKRAHRQLMRHNPTDNPPSRTHRCAIARCAIMLVATSHKKWRSATKGSCLS